MSDSEEDITEKQFKIAIVGDSATGKTSVIRRLCNQEFSRQYFPTAGVDFFLKRITLSGSRAAALHLWDVGGSALACNMLDKYVFGAQMVVLLYDITNPASLDNLEEWLSVVQTVTNRQEKPPLLVLVGNKCDMEYQRGVRPEKQQAFSIENGLTSYLVSARSGENVNKIFHERFQGVDKLVRAVHRISGYQGYQVGYLIQKKDVALCFQKLTAELLGVRLTRAEQEQHQPVVRAEISNSHTCSHDASGPPRQRQATGTRSAVCLLQ